MFVLVAPALFYLDSLDSFGFMQELKLSFAPPFSFAVTNDLFVFVLMYVATLVLFVISLAIVESVLSLARNVKRGDIFTRGNYLYIEATSYYSAYLVFLSYIFFDEMEALSLTFLGILFLFTHIFKRGIELQEDNDLTI